jgi:hypothetical protein
MTILLMPAYWPGKSVFQWLNVPMTEGLMALQAGMISNSKWRSVDVCRFGSGSKLVLGRCPVVCWIYNLFV